MTSPDPQRSAPPAADEASAPGLPGFRTWRGVYLLVLGCFVALVVLLALFTHAYS
jgi:hypothetical protein